MLDYATQESAIEASTRSATPLPPPCRATGPVTYCTVCGTEANPASRFCSSCRKPIQAAYAKEFSKGLSAPRDAIRLVACGTRLMGRAETGLVWEQDADDPFWRLDLAYGGRHARSDEYLTPMIHDVDGRRLVMLPNADLDREKSMRAAALLKWRLVGFDLAVDGSWRRLTRGISWEAEAPGADVGTWNNGLEMDSARVTGRLAREGRFLGWGRMMLEGTWRDFQEKAGRASLLPPEYDLRLHLMWENHFFQEDGIFQLALLSNRRGPMADPCDVTRTYEIPARTLHDLVV